MERIEKIKEFLKDNPTDNFLQHALDNEIKVDGQQIVYSSLALVPNQEQWLPTDAETSQFGIEQLKGDTRKAAENKYYVNPDLLVKYINSLLQSASTKDNNAQRMIKTMLGKIINKANSLFNTKMTTEYKAPEKVMSPDEVIDNVPKIISDSNIAQKGGVELKYGDISNDTALRNWVATNSIEIGVVSDKPSAPMEYITVKDGKKFDYCIVVRNLYNRAKYLLSNQSTTVELKAKYNEYVKKMAQVGPTLTSPDGKACDIGASVTTQTTTSPQVSGYGPTRTSGKPLSGGQFAAQINAYLPLRMDKIDLNKISQFLAFYSKVNPNMATITADAETKINEVNQYVFGNQKIFNLPTDNNTVQTWLKDKTKHYPFLQLLTYILKDVRVALTDLKSNYADWEGGESQIKEGESRAIDAQIKPPGSIWEHNNSDIQTLLSNIPTIQKALKNG